MRQCSLTRRAFERTLVLAVLLAMGGYAGAAAAQGTWSRQSLLNPEEISPDTLDFFVDLASDGDGNVLAIWCTQQLPASPDINDVWVSSSFNDGRTWSAPINITANNQDRNELHPSIATDGSGRWMAVWNAGTSVGPDEYSDWDIQFSHSLDNGQTWTIPAALNTDFATDHPKVDWEPVIATDNNGTWVCTWVSQSTVFSARSLDNGMTWSAPATVGNGAVPVEGYYHRDLATDGLGNWIAAWGTRRQVGQGLDHDVVYSRSVNNGATWSAQSVLNSEDPPDSGLATDPCIAADHSGRWMVVWHALEPASPLNDARVHYITSDDGGGTWSDVLVLPGTIPLQLEEPRVETDGSGRWVVLWKYFNQIGSGNVWDHGISTMYTLNHGETWYGPIRVGENYRNAVSPAQANPLRYHPRIASTRPGMWLSLWDGQKFMEPDIELMDYDTLFSRFTMDTDQDLLPDAEESDYGTDPTISDTDGDGVRDGIEVDLGTDPTNSLSFPVGLGLGGAFGAIIALAVVGGRSIHRRRRNTARGRL